MRRDNSPRHTHLRARTTALLGLGITALIWLALALPSPRAKGAALVPQPSAPVPPSAASLPPPTAAGKRPPTASTPPPPGAAVAAAPSIIALPALRRPPEQARQLWQATQALVADCMDDLGVAYAPAKFDDTAEREREFSRVDPGDVDAASALGYGLSDQLEQPRAPERAPSAMSAAEQLRMREALFGPAVPKQQRTPERGFSQLELPGGHVLSWYDDACYPRAYRELYGSDMQHNELGPAPLVLAQQVQAFRDEDPEYRAALEQWRQCARAEGIADVERPRAAAGRLSERYARGELSREHLHTLERSIAVADARCYQRAGLAEAETQATARAERATAQKHRDLALALARERELALSRAEALAPPLPTDTAP